jgi:hypothetical protein
MERTRLIQRIMCVVAALVLLITAVSLVMAYGVDGTDAWREHFSSSRAHPWHGLLIDFVRTLIFLICLCLLLYFDFRSETIKIFDPRRWSLRVTAFRAAYLVAVVLVASNEGPRLWDQSRAATELVRLSLEQETNEEAHKPALSDALPENAIDANATAYRWYLPYLLIRYCAVAIPLTLIPLFALRIDLVRMYRHLREYLDELNATNHFGVKGAEQQFHDFKVGCLRLSARYIDVLAILAVAICFENALGRTTLSAKGLQLEEIWWGTVGLSVICPIVVSYWYSRGYWQFLERRGMAASAEWMKSNNAMAYFVELLRFRPSGVIVLVALLPSVLKFLGLTPMFGEG